MRSPRTGAPFSSRFGKEKGGAPAVPSSQLDEAFFGTLSLHSHPPYPDAAYLRMEATGYTQDGHGKQAGVSVAACGVTSRKWHAKRIISTFYSYCTHSPSDHGKGEGVGERKALRNGRKNSFEKLKLQAAGGKE